MDTTSKWLLGAGAALALLVGIAVYAALTAAQGLGRGMVNVVVARAEVPERTLFTATNVNLLLATRAIPADAVPQHALAHPAEAIGKVTVRGLVPGEIVISTPDRLASGDGGAAARPATTIPRDKVALALAATEAMAVAGAIQPGDRVDIIATWTRPGGEPVSQDLFQDVRVFAVGRWQGDGRGPSPPAGGTPPATITLLLDYQQAVVVEYLLQTGGRLTLALRRFDQSETMPTEPINAETLTRRYLSDEITRAVR